MKLSVKDLQVFFCFFLIYTLFANFVGWNEESRIFTTVSIVDNLSFKINELKDFTGDRSFFEGNYYSDKPPLSAILGIPVYLVYKLFFGPLTPDVINYAPANYFLLIFLFDILSSFFGAASVVVLKKILERFFKDKQTIIVLLITYGFGTLVFSQSTVYNGHSISLFFSVLSFYFIIKNKNKLQYFLSGLFMGLAVMTDFLSVFMILPFIIFLLLSKKYVFRKTIFFLLGGLVILFFFLLFNLLIFHNLFDISYNHGDTRIFDDSLLYSPLFFDCALEKDINIFSIVKDYFVNNCEYSETLVFDTNLSIVSKGKYSSGKGFSIINQSGTELNYLYNYLTKSGNLTLIEKTVIENKFFNGKNQEVFFTYIKDVPYQDDFNLIYYRVGSGGKKYFLYRDSLFLEQNCMYGPFISNDSFSRLLNLSKCEIIKKSKSNKEVNKYSLSFSNISLTEKPDSLILKRDVVFSYKKESTLFFFNRLLRILFYPYRGLFFYSPVLIFSFFGLFFMFKNKKDTTYAMVILLLFLSYLFINSTFVFWWAGSTYGLRFWVYVIPFLMISLGHIYYISSKKTKLFLLILLSLSLFIQLLGQQELRHTQTNFILENDKLKYSENYYDDFLIMKPIDSPITNTYFNFFIEKGPSNVVIEKITGLDFGFLNILFFLLSIYTLVKLFLRPS